MSMRIPMALLFVPLLLGAAAPNSQLLRLQEEDRRIATLAWRLQTANVELCPNKSPIGGFSLHHLSQYAPEVRAEARQVFGFTILPKILAVVPGSAAARAGLAEGDELAAVGDARVNADAQLPKRADITRVAETEALIAATLKQPPLLLRVKRGGQERVIRVSPDKGCASKVELIPGSKLNASADGQSVQISTALVNFAGSDDAVATALAHELAHNILGHRARIETRQLKTRDSELEADYWSMYLIIRAGFDGARALDFWQRYESKTNMGLLSDGTHPSKRARLAIVAQALAEIREKQREGVELVPSQMNFNSKR